MPEGQTVGQWVAEKHKAGADPTKLKLLLEKVGAVRTMPDGTSQRNPAVLDMPFDEAVARARSESRERAQAPGAITDMPAGVDEVEQAIPQEPTNKPEPGGFQRAAQYVGKRAVGEAAGLAGVGAGVLGAGAEVVAKPILPAALGAFKRGAAADIERLARGKPEEYDKPDQRAPRTAAAEAYSAAEEDYAKLLGKPSYERIVQDVADMMVGIIAVPRLLLEVSDQPGYLPTGQFAKRSFESGVEVGRVLGGGMIGGTAATLANLPQAFRARPISTLMEVMPYLKAAKAVGRLDPRLAKFIDYGDRIAAAAPRKVAQTALKPVAAVAKAGLDVGRRAKSERVRKVSQYLFGVLSNEEEIMAAVNRWLVAEDAHTNGDQAAILDRLMREPEEIRAEIIGSIEELARGIRRGEVTSEAFGQQPAPMREAAPRGAAGDIPEAKPADTGERMVLPRERYGGQVSRSQEEVERARFWQERSEEGAPQWQQEGSRLQSAIKEGELPQQANRPELAAAYQTQTTVPAPQMRSAIPPDHPVVQTVLDDTIKSMEGWFERENLVQLAPEYAMEVKAGMIPSGAMDRGELAQMLTTTIRDESTQLLRSPDVAQAVIKELRKRGMSGAEANKLVQHMGTTHFMEQPFSYKVTRLPGGEADLYRIMLDVVAKNPKALAKIKAEATQNLGQAIANTAAKKRFEKLFADEVGRFGDTKSVVDLADNIIEGTIGRGEPPPLFLVSESADTGVELSRYIAGIAKRPEDLAALSVRLGIPEKQVARKLDDLARDMFRRYVPPSKTVTEKMAPVLGGRKIVGIDRGANSRMTWELKMRAALDSKSPSHRVLSRMKANLTIMNPKTHVNNFVSNMGVQSLRRGKTPVGVMTDLFESGMTARKFFTGAALDPTTEHFMRRFERDGLFQRTLVQGEIGSLGGLPLDAQVRAAMGKTYQWCDNIFKLDEALRYARGRADDMKVLRVGEHMDLDVGPSRTVRIIKQGDGYIAENLMAGGRPTARSRIVMDDRRMLDLLAKAGETSAERLFFDYSNVPNFIKALRASRAGGLVSPFLSWFWKAIDIPGLKKGLGYRIISGTELPRTNSKALNARYAKDYAAVGVRRMAALNGMRAELLAMPDYAAREMFKSLPQDAAYTMIDFTTNPEYVGTQDWRFASPFEPTMTLGRVMLGLGSAATGPDIEDLYPTDDKGRVDFGLETVDPALRDDIRAARKLFVKNASGQLWSMHDALSLAGVAGAPIIETIVEIKEANQRGRPYGVAGIMRSGGRMLLGGLYAGAFDAVTGAVSPESTASTRQYAVGFDTDATEPLAEWMIRRTIGVGWRRAHVRGQMVKYLQQQEQALQKSIMGSTTKALENLYKERQNATNPTVAAEIDTRILTTEETRDRLAEIVRHEFGTARDNYDAVVEKLGRQAKEAAR